MNVLDRIVALSLLAQAGDAQGGADAGGWGGMFNNPLLPLLVIGIMFYFLLIMPERKKRKELENLLGGLKKNDPVITAGGVCGVIVSASPGSKYVTVRVDDSNNTRIKVLRSHITHVGPHDEVQDKDVKESA